MELDPDIVDQLRRDFPAEAIPEVVAQLTGATKSQQVLRGIVFTARGHRWFLSYLCRLAKFDFRDVIKIAEYAAGDLQLRIYDFTRPIPEARIEDPLVIHKLDLSELCPKCGQNIKATPGGCPRCGPVAWKR